MKEEKEDTQTFSGKDDGVSIGEAKAHFNAYYDTKTPGYAAMSKKRDAEVKKSGKWLLIPNTPESKIYLKENGVRYYDMLGVDAFDENEFQMEDNNGKLQTYKTKKDAQTKGKVKYSEYFKKEYKKRWPDPKVNIVNFRWIKEYKKKIDEINEKLNVVEDVKEKKKLKEHLDLLKRKIEKLEKKTDTVDTVDTTDKTDNENEQKAEENKGIIEKTNDSGSESEEQETFDNDSDSFENFVYRDFPDDEDY